MLYHHTQVGFVVLASLGAAFGLTIALMLGISAIAPAPLPPGAYLAIAAVVLPCLAIFSQLTVQVTADSVHTHFGFGLFPREFAIIEIDTVARVRNPWYDGWGIRRTAEGWMYNVSGLDAIELQLASGKRFRIGTDQPQVLQAAIDRAKHDRDPQATG